MFLLVGQPTLRLTKQHLFSSKIKLFPLSRILISYLG
ncbi:hypothetical protein EVA_08229 [gut metagenome]|uniref:Uncharacterized protein n=1 Tax=gut metagenome TaxID=749906 RepID=J9GTJ1_9ZZZZ